MPRHTFVVTAGDYEAYHIIAIMQVDESDLPMHGPPDLDVLHAEFIDAMGGKPDDYGDWEDTLFEYLGHEIIDYLCVIEAAAFVQWLERALGFTVIDYTEKRL